MNEEIKDRLHRHAGKILLGGTGALLNVGHGKRPGRRTGPEARRQPRRRQDQAGDAARALLVQLPGMDMSGEP
ncbi:hypothetical protein [Streptomyces halstedii]|uniref:Uncharacterized protein n=1 Tax=Streptomyces halstedii TaxID=1944 RepID=A0A6N9UF61_STRHA|nr:hypothetical protein [Streptomyces halstedii]NEA20726.1 hypothetical protein [Streptomyces halstedii]